MWSALASCVTVVMIGTSLAVEPSCPVCSKYEFEVRLLERILNNEFTLKNTLNQITETHAKVEDSLKAIQAENVKLNTAMHSLEVKKQDINNKVDGFIDAGIRNLTETHAKVDDSLKAIQAENVKLNTAMHSLEVKKQDLNNKVDGFVDAGIRNLTGNIENLSTMVRSLVAQTSKELDIMKGPLVMFHARHLNGTYTYTVNQDVVFMTILANEGGGFDSNTGRFTVFVAGVYMFTVQYCPSRRKTASLEIVHDGKPLQRLRHYDRYYVACVTMQAFAKVAKGDKVWVRSANSTSVIDVDEGYLWNSFAGLLIRV